MSLTWVAQTLTQEGAHQQRSVRSPSDSLCRDVPHGVSSGPCGECATLGVPKPPARAPRVPAPGDTSRLACPTELSGPSLPAHTLHKRQCGWEKMEDAPPGAIQILKGTMKFQSGNFFLPKCPLGQERKRLSGENSLASRKSVGRTPECAWFLELASRVLPEECSTGQRGPPRSSDLSSPGFCS